MDRPWKCACSRETSLKEILAGAGFGSVHIASEDVPEFGVFHSETWSLPIVGRKGRFQPPSAEIARAYGQAVRKTASLARELEYHQRAHQDAERALAERLEWVRKLEAELEARTEWARKTEAELEERTQWALSLRQEKNEALAAFERGAAEAENARKHIQALETELAEARSARAKLESQPVDAGRAQIRRRLDTPLRVPAAGHIIVPSIVQVRQGGVMERINISRVFLGGIVAGIVANILGYLVDGVILAPQWTAAMKLLGKGDFTTNQIVAFNVIGLAYGVFAVWLYAAIRPRYGAGPRTAICAGLAVWVAGVLLPNAGLMGVTGLFPSDLTTISTLAGAVEWTAAILAGAALYKEGAESARTMTARA